MGVVPKLKRSCFCCSLKTGSFVTAWLLLVGSSVQTGFYAFLVDHMNPWEYCTYHFGDYGLRDEYLPLMFNYGPRHPPRNGRPNDQAAVNNTLRAVSNKSYAANTADGRPGNSNQTAQHAANTTAGQQTDSSYAANTTGRVPTNSSSADSSNSTARDSRGPQRSRRSWHSWHPFLALGFPPRQITRRCYRPYYLPFDADSRFLDFEVASPVDKTILYANIVVWVIMMAGTTLLMGAVYKERASMVGAWLVSEALLLTLATAGAVVTAVLMLRTLPVQVGIVTLLNMAIHLGIDIYLMMVVENYRQQLTTKEDDDEEETQIIV